MKLVSGVAILLLAFLPVLLAGCSQEPSQITTGEPSPSPSPRSGGVLRLGYVRGELELDVHRASGLTQAHYLLFDPLLTRSPDGDYAGHLLTGWEVREGGLEVALHVRSGVVFHDGQEFTPQALADNLWRLQEKARSEAFLPSIVRRFADSLQGIEINEDSSVLLQFKGVFPQLFHLMTLPYLAPMSPWSWKDGNDPGGQPVGTGPFRIGERYRDGTIGLIRNDDYRWAPHFFSNNGPPHINEVVLKPYADEVRILGAFRSGLLDLCSLPEFAFGTDHESEEVVFHSFPRRNLIYLAFNLHHELYMQEEVRRALAMAVDRRALVDGGVSVPAQPVSAPLAPGVWGYREGLEMRAGLDYDRDRSQYQLMSQGLVDHDWIHHGSTMATSHSLEILSFRGGDNPEVASMLADQISQVGIRAHVTVVDSQEMWHRIHMGDFQAALLSHAWDEPSFLSRYFHSQGDLNRTGVKDEDLDLLLEDLDSTLEPGRRRLLLYQVQEHLVSKAYCIWLYSPLEITAASPSLLEFFITPWGQYWLQDAYIHSEDGD